MKWFVGVLEVQISRCFEADDGSVGLSRQGCSLPFCEKVRGVNRSAGLIDEYHLTALFFYRWSLNRVADAGVQCQCWGQPPGVVEVKVIGLDRASHLGLLA